MPVWHEKTKALRKSGKLAVVGIVQEQHAERARLYAQWKGFDWPILQDQMTNLGLAVVPVVSLMDEHGVVQATRIRRPEQLEALLNESASPPSSKPAEFNSHQAPQSLLKGDLALMQVKPTKAIENYRAFLQTCSEAEKPNKKDEQFAQTLFRLGVAYRAKFDASESPAAADFENASKYWTQAMQENPGQYIWRRRIEQYGPRNIKPYPFYDWVEQAIADIRKRGDEPVELKAELSGAEIAKPSRQAEFKSDTNPDPNSKVPQVDSSQPEFHVATSSVPHQVKRGKTVRVHLQLQLGKTHKWNNESTPLQVWVNSNSTGKPSTQLMEIKNASDSVSNEIRLVDFEFATDSSASEVVVEGFVLANVCSNVDGVCSIRRRDFKLQVELAGK